MPQYSSYDSLVPKYASAVVMVQLTADPDSNDYNEAVLDALAADTYTLINAKLRGRYPVPFASDCVPPEILQISDVLTMQALYARNPSLELSSGVSRQYKAAQDALDDYCDGKLILLGFEGATQGPAFSAVSSRRPEFGRRVLHAFSPDVHPSFLHNERDF